MCIRDRFIAVKVLKQEFSENANFVSKFRIEAQAAAGLMHPNIVKMCIRDRKQAGSSETIRKKAADQMVLLSDRQKLQSPK